MLTNNFLHDFVGRLVWLHQMGSVDLDLWVDEKKVTFNCTPLQATLICYFQDKERWSSDELANETGILEDDVVKYMEFWIQNRIIHIIPHYDDTYESILFELCT